MMTIYLFTVLVLVLSANNVQGQGRGSVRLFDQGNSSTSINQGIVEIYYNNIWGPVCYQNGQTPTDVANTVCRQLGHTSGDILSAINYGPIETPAEISIQSCGSDNLNLLSCDTGVSPIDCTETDILAVHCSSNIPANNFNGKVRLRGQTAYTGEGRIEVYCNSAWGLICSDRFTSNDANTICRQLGYTKGTISNTIRTSNLIWFHFPGCGSSKQCISSCTSCPSLPLSSCPFLSNTVAGVICSYESNTLTGTYEHCSHADTGSSISIKEIVAIVTSCLIVIGICVAGVAIPFICYYCCPLALAGIVASAKRSKYSPV